MRLGFGDTYIEVVIDGEDRHFSLSEHPTLSIGRSDKNTVVLSDDIMVSRKHALIQRESSGEYYLSDLGSRNGTTLNGIPVTAPVLLRDGYSFTTGSHKFFFRDSMPEIERELTMVSQDATGVLVVRRMLTILVVDIRNYTGLARDLGESRISEIMNGFFHASGELLRQNGSWAQKYIGDAVMAVWAHDEEGGTPRELVHMLESVVGISRIVAELNRDFSPPEPLAFGVGINSGFAVTGNMGSAGLADHTAMGDTVNMAFRLESASKELGRDLVLGRSTFDLLAVPEGVLDFFTRHRVSLKGYDEPMDVRGLGLDQVGPLIEALKA